MVFGANTESRITHTQKGILFENQIYSNYLIYFYNTSQVHRKHHRKSAAQPYILDAAVITITAKGYYVATRLPLQFVLV